MRSTLRASDTALRVARPAAAAPFRAAQAGFNGVYAAPAVLIGRSMFYALLLLVLSSFWDKVAAERVPGGLAHVLPAGGLAVYIGITEWITLGTPSIHLRLEDDIRSGALESGLLRPKSHLVLRLGEGAGALLARLCAVAAVALILLALSRRQGPPLGTYPALVLVGALGGIVGVLNLALVGLTAFWLRRTLPVYLVNQKLSFLLGGLVAPITLYPPWLERIGMLSPFAAQLYWPAAFALNPKPEVLAKALASQLAWILLLALATAGAWSLGLRKLLREGV